MKTIYTLDFLITKILTVLYELSFIQIEAVEYFHE